MSGREVPPECRGREVPPECPVRERCDPNEEENEEDAHRGWRQNDGAVEDGAAVGLLGVTQPNIATAECVNEFETPGLRI